MNLATPTFARSVAGIARTSIRPASTIVKRRKYQPELSGHKEGHGEQIWVFDHQTSGQVIYSHSPVIDANRALRQIPFNGKKTKPAKIRKDYWRPMAVIEFAKGDGLIGQSVFQKLREFKTLHEVSWGWQKSELMALARRTRGFALNNQKPNCIADMAAVLGGAGKGNKIRQVEEEDGGLAEATVYWANERDRDYAEAWPMTVSHTLGIPSRSQAVDMSEVAPEEAETEGQALSQSA